MSDPSPDQAIGETSGPPDKCPGCGVSLWRDGKNYGICKACGWPSQPEESAESSAPRLIRVEAYRSLRQDRNSLAAALQSEKDAHAKTREEVDDLRRGVMMPGAQECIVCGFTLQKMVMRGEDGAVGMNAAAPLEECPNGHGFLIGTTWERAFRGAMKIAEDAISARNAAESKLAAAEKEVEELRGFKKAHLNCRLLDGWMHPGDDAP